MPVQTMTWRNLSEFAGRELLAIPEPGERHRVDLDGGKGIHHVNKALLGRGIVCGDD